MEKQIQVTCKCGNEYYLCGKEGEWNINIQGPVVLTCPCGEKFDLLEYGIEALLWSFRKEVSK